MNGANWHYRCRSVNGHAAAVQVVEANHAVDIRVFWQQIALNNFDHVIHHACDAVYAGANPQQVFGAYAAVGITVAFKGIAFKRGQRLRDFGRQRQGIQRRCAGQLQDFAPVPARRLLP